MIPKLLRFAPLGIVGILLGVCVHLLGRDHRVANDIDANKATTRAVITEVYQLRSSGYNLRYTYTVGDSSYAGRSICRFCASTCKPNPCEGMSIPIEYSRLSPSHSRIVEGMLPSR